MSESKTGRGLSYPKMGILGLQHVFAMFGATILVPLISGLSVQVTLIGAGVGTLIFHFITKGRIPAFLGSSFAFLVGIQLITDPVSGIFAGTAMSHDEKLAYATGGIIISGLVYLLVALLIKLIGVKNFMRYMPPVVTAPTVILIGIMLAPVAINQSRSNVFLAMLTLGLVIIAATWGKRMVKIVPILIGIGGAYLIAVGLHFVGVENPGGGPIMDFSTAAQSRAVGLPVFMMPKFSPIAILVMIPFALATIAEHVGDMTALSTIIGKKFVEDPGLTRTLIGDGLASCFSGFLGGPATTTYSENIGVVAITRVFDSRVVQLAAIYATLLGFSPLFAAIIYSVPAAIIGGASFMLYGMIAAVGVRNLVENKVDIGKTKN
ncbi:MAG: uracil-xanthine permease, partial [Treponema sp.]|nr:uracil-xanthine permease [Treponema sp.]